MQNTKRIGSLVAVVLATGTLAGCTFGNRGLYGMRDTTPNGTINYNTENGTGSINFSENGLNITGENGNSTVNFGSQKLPDNWPSDLPTPNGTLGFSGSTKGEDGSTSFSAVYTISGSASDAVNDMKSKFQAAGWTVSGEYNANYNGAANAGFSAEKGQNTATVFIGADSTNASQISVTIAGEYK
ncbi:MAG: hypothetical protein U0517_03470 [Candidatus Andersenbacteria bacterium]